MESSPRTIFPRFGERPTVTEAFERPAAWRRTRNVLRVLLFGTFALTIFFVNQSDESGQTSLQAITPTSWQYSGALTETDMAYDDGSGRFDHWLAYLSPGQSLQVTMTADEFEPFFYVFGPVSDDNLAESEIAVDGRTAFGEVTATSEGDYVVVIPSDAGAAIGAYQLTSNIPLVDPAGTPGFEDFGGGFEEEAAGSTERLGMLFAGLWVVLLIGLPALLLWPHPDRILLLRPFGEQHISRALKKFNRTTLSYRGFTFTLADKHLKDSFTAYALAHVPLDLGSLATVLYRPLFRRIHRYLVVRKPSDLAILRLRLRSRWRLTAFWLSWFGLTDRISKVRSRDEHWKECIGILLDNCQVIVLDVSRAGEGTSWEIEEIYRRGFLYKTVFMVADNVDEVIAASRLVAHIAVRALEAAGKTARTDDPGLVPVLHRYSPVDGSLADGKAFDQAYARAVSSDQQPQPANLPVSGKVILSPFLPGVGLVLALLGLQDIRRARGMLSGEVVAHSVILSNLVLLGLVGVLLIFLRGV